YGVYNVGWGSTGSFYGALGLTDAKIKEQSIFGIAEVQETSMSVGFGLNVAGFNFEYMHYLFDTNFDVTAIAFGYVTSF
ncbi:MAG: hypothetical protein OEY09_11785, partial [Gammaproteobacteria bacterium]|nr:hypothetical protein [Gammaproteobacteria bacterium]